MDIYRICIEVLECKSYVTCTAVLNKVCRKPVNKIFLKYLLATRNQKTVDQYVQALRFLSKNCNFQVLTLEKHRVSFYQECFYKWFFTSTTEHV